MEKLFKFLSLPFGGIGFDVLFIYYFFFWFFPPLIFCSMLFSSDSLFVVVLPFQWFSKIVHVCRNGFHALSLSEALAWRLF